MIPLKGMADYQETVIVRLLVPLIMLLAIAVIYFVFNRNQSLWYRIFASSPSLIAIASVLYAVIASKYTSLSSFAPHTTIFSNILVIACIFGFVAVLYFKGNKSIHLLLLPFLLCIAYIWYVGGMAITHVWV